jgi:hypothetical protein
VLNLLGGTETESSGENVMSWVPATCCQVAVSRSCKRCLVPRALLPLPRRGGWGSSLLARSAGSVTLRTATKRQQRGKSDPCKRFCPVLLDREAFEEELDASPCHLIAHDWTSSA